MLYVNWIKNTLLKPLFISTSRYGLTAVISIFFGLACYASVGPFLMLTLPEGEPGRLSATRSASQLAPVLSRYVNQCSMDCQKMSGPGHKTICKKVCGCSYNRIQQRLTPEAFIKLETALTQKQAVDEAEHNLFVQAVQGCLSEAYSQLRNVDN
jgi:hypothetical protein